jgi:hypothetical protein
MISINKAVKESLNKWDDLSPLKEHQIKSIQLLNQFNQFQQSSDVDLDEQLMLLDLNNKLKGEDDSKKKQESNKTKLGSRSAIDMNVSFEINEDINELLYNFDVNDIEDPRIEKYVNTLNKNLKKTNMISESIEEALANLNLLLDNYSQVSQKTRSLHVACEQLLNDQVSFQAFKN